MKVPEIDLAWALLPVQLLMKSVDHDQKEFDQNWKWPQKTWFQERLKVVKAREAEQRREDGPREAIKPLRRHAKKNRGQP